MTVPYYFETKSGDIYEIEVESKYIAHNKECHTMIEFADGKVFRFDDDEGDHKLLFDYIRENYKPASVKK